jgi:hypothetical protein
MLIKNDTVRRERCARDPRTRPKRQVAKKRDIDSAFHQKVKIERA